MLLAVGVLILVFLAVLLWGATAIESRFLDVDLDEEGGFLGDEDEADEDLD